MVTRFPEVTERGPYRTALGSHHQHHHSPRRHSETCHVCFRKCEFDVFLMLNRRFSTETEMQQHGSQMRKKKPEAEINFQLYLKAVATTVSNVHQNKAKNTGVSNSICAALC